MALWRYSSFNYKGTGDVKYTFVSKIEFPGRSSSTVLSPQRPTLLKVHPAYSPGTSGHIACRYLLDSDTDLCVFPRSKSKNQPPKVHLRVICVKWHYRQHWQLRNPPCQPVSMTWLYVEFSLSGRRAVHHWLWFSCHYGLMVDLEDDQLIDKWTLLSSKGKVVKWSTPIFKIVSADPQYH